MRSKSCVRCGREEAHHGEFVGAFCPECLAGTGAVRVREARIHGCTRCMRIRVGNLWMEATQKAMTHLASAKLRTRYPVAEAHIVSVNKKSAKWAIELNLKLVADGTTVDQKETVYVKITRVRCPDCTKMSAGYHELILQIRGPDNKVKKLAERARRELSHETMITKSEVKGEGIDLYVADKHPAMLFVMRLHKPYKATRKLLGVKKGRHHFITTICVRLDAPTVPTELTDAEQEGNPLKKPPAQSVHEEEGEIGYGDE